MGATAMLVGGAALSAGGAIKQGNQQKTAAYAQAQERELQAADAEANAQAAEYNAAGMRARGVQADLIAGFQEDAQRRAARAAIGLQLAAGAGSGAGINPDLLRMSIFDAESDSQAIRYEGRLKSAGMRDEARLTDASAESYRRSGSGLTAAAGNIRMQGDDAQQAGYLNAAGSLLNAGSSYSSGKSKGAY